MRNIWLAIGGEASRFWISLPGTRKSVPAVKRGHFRRRGPIFQQGDLPEHLTDSRVAKNDIKDLAFANGQKATVDDHEQAARRRPLFNDHVAFLDLENVANGGQPIEFGIGKTAR